ncbi:hypothetical protein Mal64_09130 [Pseudobythopirellula maris]|uniref:PEP-CTERM protein-sorting domain-containing protein n=1 Tax=Pseudobythopirellula maris TaxID=2527991 RepID=A0A5C5ZSK2_9BACT|nr:hypothetical protein [Pseudobythopirellula maris]TWT90522.1 hypothetical protein Mal64_09130 [Pseudobythopirellula maris]
MSFPVTRLDRRTPALAAASRAALAALSVLLPALAMVGTAHAQFFPTRYVPSDTVISAANSYSGSKIDVRNNTEVRLVAGGEVSGFVLSDNSELIVDGGAVNFLSELHDSSKLTMRSGRASCGEIDCVWINYYGFIFAEDNSQVDVYGGDIEHLYLLDQSTLRVYGRDLMKNGEWITGWGEGDTWISTRVSGGADQIFLIELPPLLAGDFNNDHVVDAADFTVWRDGLGDRYSQADYETWRANYGETYQPAATIPEPATALIIVPVAAALLARRRRRAPGVAA